jgi:hypothetical protein
MPFWQFNCYICENVYNAWRFLFFLIFFLHAILPPLWSLHWRTVSVNELFTLLIERAIALCWLFVRQISILYIREQAKLDHYYCRHVAITNWRRRKRKKNASRQMATSPKLRVNIHSVIRMNLSVYIWHFFFCLTQF